MWGALQSEHVLGPCGEKGEAAQLPLQPSEGSTAFHNLLCPLQDRPAGRGTSGRWWAWEVLGCVALTFCPRSWSGKSLMLNEKMPQPGVCAG